MTETDPNIRQRPAGTWTPAVASILDDLAAAGVHAPRHLSLHGNTETVTHLEGLVPIRPYPPEVLTDDALASVGRLLRRHHDVLDPHPRPADLAEEHLRRYAAVIQEINQLISDTVASEMTRAGQECLCGCPGCGLGICLCAAHGINTINQAWQETSPSLEGPGIRVRRPRSGARRRERDCARETESWLQMVKRFPGTETSRCYTRRSGSTDPASRSSWKSSEARTGDRSAWFVPRSPLRSRALRSAVLAPHRSRRATARSALWALG